MEINFFILYLIITNGQQIIYFVITEEKIYIIILYQQKCMKNDLMCPLLTFFIQLADSTFTNNSFLNMNMYKLTPKKQCLVYTFQNF